MLSKNNFKERLRKMEPKKDRFSIRKFTIGAVSVLIGSVFFAMGGQQAQAETMPSKDDGAKANEESNANSGQSAAQKEVGQVQSEIKTDQIADATSKLANSDGSLQDKQAAARAINKETSGLTAQEKADAANKIMAQQESKSSQATTPNVDAKVDVPTTKKNDSTKEKAGQRPQKTTPGAESIEKADLIDKDKNTISAGDLKASDVTAKTETDSKLDATVENKPTIDDIEKKYEEFQKEASSMTDEERLSAGKDLRALIEKLPLDQRMAVVNGQYDAVNFGGNEYDVSGDTVTINGFYGLSRAICDPNIHKIKLTSDIDLNNMTVQQADKVKSTNGSDGTKTKNVLWSDMPFSLTGLKAHELSTKGCDNIARDLTIDGSYQDAEGKTQKHSLNMGQWFFGFASNNYGGSNTKWNIKISNLKISTKDTDDNFGPFHFYVGSNSNGENTTVTYENDDITLNNNSLFEDNQSANKIHAIIKNCNITSTGSQNIIDGAIDVNISNDLNNNGIIIANAGLVKDSNSAVNIDGGKVTLNGGSLVNKAGSVSVKNIKDGSTISDADMITSVSGDIALNNVNVAVTNGSLVDSTDSTVALSGQNNIVNNNKNYNYDTIKAGFLNVSDGSTSIKMTNSGSTSGTNYHGNMIYVLSGDSSDKKAVTIADGATLNLKGNTNTRGIVTQWNVESTKGTVEVNGTYNANMSNGHSNAIVAQNLEIGKTGTVNIETKQDNEADKNEYLWSNATANLDGWHQSVIALGTGGVVGVGKVFSGYPSSLVDNGTLIIKRKVDNAKTFCSLIGYGPGGSGNSNYVFTLNVGDGATLDLQDDGDTSFVSGWSAAQGSSLQWLNTDENKNNPTKDVSIWGLINMPGGNNKNVINFNNPGYVNLQRTGHQRGVLIREEGMAQNEANIDGGTNGTPLAQWNMDNSTDTPDEAWYIKKITSQAAGNDFFSNFLPSGTDRSQLQGDLSKKYWGKPFSESNGTAQLTPFEGSDYAYSNGSYTGKSMAGVSASRLAQLTNDFSWWNPRRLTFGSKMVEEGKVTLKDATQYNPNVKTIETNTNKELSDFTPKEGIENLKKYDGTATGTTVDNDAVDTDGKKIVDWDKSSWGLDWSYTKFTEDGKLRDGSAITGAQQNEYNALKNMIITPKVDSNGNLAKSDATYEVKDAQGNVVKDKDGNPEMAMNGRTATIVYTDGSADFVNIPFDVKDPLSAKYTPSYPESKGFNDEVQTVTPTIMDDATNKDVTIADIVSQDDKQPAFKIADPDSKFSVDPKTGVITVPKDTTPGKYTVNVDVTYKDGSSEPTKAIINVDEAPKVSGLHTDDATKVPAPSGAITNLNNKQTGAQDGYPSKVEWTTTPTFEDGFKGTKDFEAKVTYPDGNTKNVKIPVSVTGAKQDGNDTIYYGDQSSVEFSGDAVDTHKTTGDHPLDVNSHKFNKIIVNKDWNRDTDSYGKTITYKLSDDGQSFVNVNNENDKFDANSIKYGWKTGFEANSNEASFKDADGNVIKGNTLKDDDAEKTKSGESLTGNSRYRYTFTVSDPTVAEKLGVPKDYSSWVNAFYNFYSATAKDGTVEAVHGKTDSLPDASTVVNTTDLTKEHNSEIATKDGKPDIQWVNGSVDFSKTGAQTGKVQIKFTDGTHLDVEVPVNVKNNDADNTEPTAQDVVVPEGTDPVAKNGISNTTDLDKISDPSNPTKHTEYTWKTTPDKTPGKHDATVIVTYPDGSKDEVPTHVTVNATPTVKPIEVEKGKTPPAKNGIANLNSGKDTPQDGYPSGADWVTTPDTTKTGVQYVTANVHYPSGNTDDQVAEIPVIVTDPTNQSVISNDNGVVIVTSKPVVTHKTSDTEEASADKAIDHIDVYTYDENHKLVLNEAASKNAAATVTWATPVTSIVANNGSTTSDAEKANNIKVTFGAGTDAAKIAGDKQMTVPAKVTLYGASAKSGVTATHGKAKTLPNPSALVDTTALTKANNSEVTNVTWAGDTPNVDTVGKVNTSVSINFADGSHLVVPVSFDVNKNDADTYDPKGQPTTIKQGDKVPDAKTSIDPDSIKTVPDGTTYTWVGGKTPDPSTPGQQDVEVTVTYPDKTTDTVDTIVTVNAKPTTIPISINQNQLTPSPDDTVNEENGVLGGITNIKNNQPGYPTSVIWKSGQAPVTSKVGVQNPVATVTYPSGDKVDVVVPVVVIDNFNQNVNATEIGAVVVTTKPLIIHKTSDKNVISEDATSYIKSVDVYIKNDKGELVKDPESSSTGVTATWAEDLTTIDDNVTTSKPKGYNVNIIFDEDSEAVKKGILIADKDMPGGTNNFTVPDQVTLEGATGKTDIPVNIGDTVPTSSDDLKVALKDYLASNDLDQDGINITNVAWANGKQPGFDGKFDATHKDGTIEFTFKDGDVISHLDVPVSFKTGEYIPTSDSKTNDDTNKYITRTIKSTGLPTDLAIADQTQTVHYVRDGYKNVEKDGQPIWNAWKLANDSKDWIAVPTPKVTDDKTGAEYTPQIESNNVTEVPAETVTTDTTDKIVTVNYVETKTPITASDANPATKDVTRTIIDKLPSGKKTTTQIVSFNRKDDKGNVGYIIDGQNQMNDWKITSEAKNWPSYKVGLKGYTASATDENNKSVALGQNGLSEQDVTGDTPSTTITITYKKNADTPVKADKDHSGEMEISRTITFEGVPTDKQDTYKDQTQTVKFTRVDKNGNIGYQDPATDVITYNPWKVVDANGKWDAVDAPTITEDDGSVYTPTITVDGNSATSIPEVTVSAGTNDKDDKNTGATKPSTVKVVYTETTTPHKYTDGDGKTNDESNLYVTRTIKYTVPAGKDAIADQVQTVHYIRKDGKGNSYYTDKDGKKTYVDWTLADGQTAEWPAKDVNQITNYDSYVDDTKSTSVAEKPVTSETTDATVQVTYKDSTMNVKPGDPGVTPENPSNDEYKNLFHDVTRTVTIDGQTDPVKQTVHFGRTGVFDKATGKFLEDKYGEWKVLNGNQLTDQTQGKWDEVNVAKAGYTPSAKDAKGNDVALTDNKVSANEAVKADTDDVSIVVTYAANTHTYTVNYEDKDGNKIDNPYVVSGKTGEHKDLDVPGHVPAGWKIVPNTSYDQSITFGSDSPASQTKTITVEHIKTTESGLDEKNKDNTDLRREVTRKITLSVPGLDDQNIDQTVTLYRDKTVDEALKAAGKTEAEYTSYSEWKPFYSNQTTNFDKFNVSTTTKDGKTVPIAAGYIPNGNGVTLKEENGDMYVPSASALDASGQPVANSEVHVTYDAKTGLTQKIEYVSVFEGDNNKVVGSQIVTGKADSKGTLISEGEPNSGQFLLNVPKGWKLVDPNFTKEFNFTPNAKAIDVHITHATHEVDKDNVPANHDKSEFTKDITRTITVTKPGETKPEDHSQTITITRTGIYDEVTKTVTYGDWTEGNFAEYDAPTVDGYTPSQAKVDIENGVTDDYKDPKINITYTANDSHQTFHYVDENGKNTTGVPDVQIPGKTDEQKHGSDVPVPDGWELVDNPSDFTIPAPEKDTPINVKIKHGKTEVTPEDPKKPGDKIPGTKDQHFPSGVDTNNLNKTISRTITIVKPDGTKNPIMQNVSYKRTATVDNVTKDVTYSNWTPADPSVTGFEGVTAPKLPGYTADKTIAALIPDNDEITNWDNSKHNETIGYTAGDQSVSFKFVDDNDGGKQVGDIINLGGNTNETKKIGLTIPDGYKLAEGQTLPTEYKFKDNNPEITIHLVHATNEVDKDHVPEDHDKSEFTEDIKRTITITMPDGKQVDKSQTTTITRTGTLDEVTGKVTFNDWSTSHFDKVTVLPVEGYTPSQSEVPEVDNVTDGYKDPDIQITYTKDKSQADNNNPITQDITVKKGDTPIAKDGIKNSSDLDKLPDPTDKGNTTKYTWKDGMPDTSVPGDKPGTVVVTYPDGSKDEVSVTIHVHDSSTGDSAEEPDKPVLIIVEYKDPTGKVVKTDAKEGNIGDDVQIGIPDGYIGTPITHKITGDESVITVNVVPEPTSSDIDINIGETPNPKSGISNNDKMPDGTKFTWKNGTPDTSKPGDQNVIVEVTLPDGTTRDVPTVLHVKDNTPAGPSEGGGDVTPTPEPQPTEPTQPTQATEAKKSTTDDMDEMPSYTPTKKHKKSHSKKHWNDNYNVHGEYGLQGRKNFNQNSGLHGQDINGMNGNGNNENANALPETGEKEDQTGMIGLALAGLAGLTSLAGARKRKRR